MKRVLFALIVALALIVPLEAVSCKTKPDGCNGDQCCVQFGFFGICRPLLEEGEKCELQSLISKQNKHVYLMRCPCGEGLKCEEDDSGSTLQGKCVPQ